MNPIAELVVAPKIEIGVDKLWKGHAIAQEIQQRTYVQTRFSVLENFLFITSSIESLEGRTQNGVAIITTNIIPKSAT